MTTSTDSLFSAVRLPCGTQLPHRIAKAAMSDSLGDGDGTEHEPAVRRHQLRVLWQLHLQPDVLQQVMFVFRVLGTRNTRLLRPS